MITFKKFLTLPKIIFWQKNLEKKFHGLNTFQKHF